MGTGRTDAFRRCISQRSGAYSDRGSQYYSHDYQKILPEHGVQSSISSKGNC
jgi:transposase InsO family protein